jgi:Secretion system C-terminal sorting domain
MKFSHLRFTLLAALLCCTLPFHLNAQCEYRLDMADAFGDGWTGGRLVIANGARRDTFSLGLNPGDGRDSTLYFRVVPGQLTMTWIAGTFPVDISFAIFDNAGAPVVRRSNPQPGVVLSVPLSVDACPTCSSPQVRITRVIDTLVRLQITPATEVVQEWWVIYGPRGFVPGPGRGDTFITTDIRPIIRRNIRPKRLYDFYVVQRCDTSRFSALKGPFTVETYRSRDVGVCGVQTPTTTCGLKTNEEVGILIQNYGALAQSFIPINYAVNGIVAPVAQPDDGLYTGVLGQDSCILFKFETRSDFSGSGEYLIEAWSALEKDQLTANDTFRTRVINRIALPYNQNFEVWSGGWRVNTASTRSTWQFGVPRGDIIKSAASGRNAWVTNLSGSHASGERSFLDLPCIDFSTIGTTNPVLECSINYDIERNDGAWFEISTDGARTWSRLGVRGQGLNWYNSSNGTFGGDLWTGRSNGWITARFPLSGVAGRNDVRIRLVFRANETIESEGFGIDNVRIYVPSPNDLAALNATSTGDSQPCGLPADRVVFQVTNFGRTTVPNFQVAYSVNGGTPVIERVDSIFAPNQRITYTFRQTFNSQDNNFVIRCWTVDPNEQVRSNDTTVYRVDHQLRSLPFRANFETGRLPDGWTTDRGVVVNGHGNSSQVLAAALTGTVNTFRHQSPRYGVVSATDTLRFDYRIVNFDTRGTTTTVLTGLSRLEVQVSTDCGVTYNPIFSVSSGNQTPQTTLRNISVGLGRFANQRILIRFEGFRATGSFWVDIDNINISVCPARLGLAATNVRASSPTTANGSATVSTGVGIGPFTYAWSTGATTQTANSLPTGPVTVSVTDSRGCTDELRINIGNTAVQDIEGLQLVGLRPNPTTGIAQLYLRLDQPKDIELSVLNSIGQLVRRERLQKIGEATVPIDLTGLQSGTYFIRLSVGSGVKTLRLVKTE